MRLPIAARELRVAAHAPGTYRSRLGIAVLGIAATVWALAGLTEFSGVSSYWIAQTLFTTEAWAIVFMAAVGGFSATADSISQEKRGGTLGLLFLTHLKGSDVVLGKLTSKTLNALSGVLALFPVLAVPLLMGGAQFSQCARLLLAALNALLFSASVGLFVSAISWRQQRAHSAALGILLLFMGGLPFTAFVLGYFHYDPLLCLALDLLSPTYLPRTAFGGLSGFQQFYFWLSALLVFLLSCGFLSLASWFAPRCWQEKAKETLRQRIGSRFAANFGGLIRSRSAQGRRMLDLNPYSWLTIRDKSISRNAWAFVAFAVIASASLIALCEMWWSPVGVRISLCAPLVVILLAGLKTRIGGNAVFRLAEAKENGALELILSTPLKFTQIISGQFQASWRIFGLQLIACVVLVSFAYILSRDGIDALAETFTTPPQTAFFRSCATFALAEMIVFLFLDSVALTWMGMCCALRAPNPPLARAWTGFWVMALPIIIFALVIVGCFHFQTLRSHLEGFYPFAILFAVISLIVDLGVILFSRKWLLNYARDAVALPLQNTREQPAWSWWLGLSSLIRAARLPGVPTSNQGNRL